MTTGAELDGIAKSAALARLDLSAEERAELVRELARILQAFEVLARFPGPAPAAPAEPGARERPDVVRPSLAPEAVLAQAPEALDGFFAVPKTVGAER